MNATNGSPNGSPKQTSAQYIGAHPKAKQDQKLAADLSSDSALTDPCSNKWHVTFNTTKTKLTTFQYYRAEREVLSSYDKQLQLLG